MSEEPQDTKANYEKTVRLVKRAEKAANKFLSEEPKQTPELVSIREKMDTKSQKACKCHYCHGCMKDDASCPMGCPCCIPPQEEQPKEWESKYREVWEGANVWSTKAIDEQIKFINYLITLAVQKERERITNKLQEHRMEAANGIISFEEDEALAILNNKEEEK